MAVGKWGRNMMIEKWALFSFSHPSGAYRGRFSFVPSFSVGLSKWLLAKPLSGTCINLEEAPTIISRSRLNFLYLTSLGRKLCAR